MITLPTICEPCADVPEVVLVPQLPDTMCPCPPPPVDDISPLLPTKTIISVTDDCFASMLKNMTSVKFCTVGPPAC
jgi:hypothetical protein